MRAQRAVVVGGFDTWRLLSSAGNLPFDTARPQTRGGFDLSQWSWWAGALLASPYVVVPVVADLRGRRDASVRDWELLPASESPLVSVVIPARNEARNIEDCLRSVLASAYPSFEVVVVDDRSTDSTGQLAEAVAKQDPRARVVRGAELPASWFGKPWACWQGFQVARGSLLLFTDADTRHGPAILGHTVAMLLREHADLVSVMPRQEALGFWERVVQPHYFQVVRYMSAQRANRATDLRLPVANGQFILVTRASYEALDGHRAVKGEVVEDLMIAWTYAKAGRRLRIALAEQDITTRMYASLGEIVEGWSKNLFTALLRVSGSRRVYLWVAGFLLLLPGTWLLPPAALALGLALGSPAVTAFGAVASAGALLSMALLLRHRLMRAPAWYAVFYPLGALVQAYIMLRGTWRGTRKIVWRGRTYGSAP